MKIDHGSGENQQATDTAIQNITQQSAACTVDWATALQQSAAHMQAMFDNVRNGEYSEKVPTSILAKILNRLYVKIFMAKCPIIR